MAKLNILFWETIMEAHQQFAMTTFPTHVKLLYVPSHLVASGHYGGNLDLAC